MPRFARKAERRAVAVSRGSCAGMAFARSPVASSGPCTTDSRHHLPVAPNLLRQKFVATAPNRAWLADITYIATGEGWLYLAAVLALATRKIVGWSMRDHMRTELPLAALMMAAQRQRPAPGLVHHSDRGSQGRWRASSTPSRSSSSTSGDGQPAKRPAGTSSPISRAIIIGGVSTPPSAIEPRSKPNGKWLKSVSTETRQDQTDRQCVYRDI
jgi:hypothetical protein